MDSEAIKATAELASSLSQFKIGMFIALCLTVLGGVFMFFWFRRAMLKDRDRAEEAQKIREQELETAKQARAALFTQAQLENAKAMATLATTIQTTHDGMTSLNLTTNRTLAELGSTIGRNSQVLVTVANAVRRMTDKVDGRISRADSQRFIAAKLNSDMFRAICAVIERSFNENHYQGRELFIADRVRSRIRDVMVAVRDELKDLPLAMPVETYFPNSVDDTGERFVLCDAIWSRLSHLFEDQRPVDKRMEEASLMIENLIKDHVARVVRKDMGSSSDIVPAQSAGGTSSDIMRAISTAAAAASPPAA
jgi:hypothetical protein